MAKIAMLMPIRNRPNELIRFWQSVVNTADDISNLKLYLYIDDDDLLSLTAVLPLQESFPDQIHYIVRPRIVFSAMLDILYQDVKEDIIYLCGDDLIQRTLSWDKIIIDFFDSSIDKLWLVSGDDLVGTAGGNEEGFASHPIIHKRWIETVGYISLPCFEFDYSDNYINDIAKLINRRKRLPFINEHMHFILGKSQIDTTYIERRVNIKTNHPSTIYRQCVSSIIEAANKLNNLKDTKYE